MACSLLHNVDKIKAMVQKQIEEDKVHHLAIMNLAIEFENASIAKDDMRKEYDECTSKNLSIGARLSSEMSLHSAYCFLKSSFAALGCSNNLITPIIASWRAASSSSHHF
ncbi:hypothetical protein Tco_0692656 [Tanacetum coccineum]